MRTVIERIQAWAGPRVPVLQAIALFGIGTVVLASGLPVLVSLGQDQLPPSHPLRLVTLAVLCGAELLRQRAPGVGLTVALVIAGAELSYGVTLATLIVLTDLLFSATVFGSRRTNQLVVWTSGAVVLVLVVVSIVSAHGLRDVVVVILQVCSLPLIPVWWGMNVRHHRSAASAERARADQLARISELDRNAAVQAERARMARDLHDVIAGQLSGIAIQSEAALNLPDPDPEVLRRVLQSVRRDSVASLAEMRTMIGLLRADGAGDGDPRTAPAGLDRLDSLLESAGGTGLRIEVDDARSGAAELPAAVDLAAFRIVQESLTNAAKHAPRSRVRLSMDDHDGELVIEIENDLVPGAPAGGGTGTGLLGLHERADAVGGTATAGPDCDRWRVRAVLPMRAAAGAPR
jgi:signal transduction histidine kinase